MPIIKSVMTDGAKNLSKLSPYEKYLLNSMVQSSLKIVKKGSIAYKFMKHLGAKLESFEKTPFEYIQGSAPSAACHGHVKIFSWNTCLLPGKLPKIFSGLSPWYERLELIIHQIYSQNADVVCLQEVHSEPAASAIYHALKKDYAHFYVNMGPKMMASDVADIGLNSGLFVASKFPLKNMHFEAFASDEGQKNVNKGFFWAQIENTDVGFSTCHLEPFNKDHSKKVRFEELSYLVQFLASRPQQVRLLTGDLNIPWGSGEQAESLIRNHFFDPYNKNRQSVSKYSRTFSDVFVSKHHDGSCDILDYFLILQVPGFEKYAFMTERVEGFDEVKLETKGSDHHGLMSQIIFPYYQK